MVRNHNIEEQHRFSEVQFMMKSSLHTIVRHLKHKINANKADSDSKKKVQIPLNLSFSAKQSQNNLLTNKSVS